MPRGGMKIAKPKKVEAPTFQSPPNVASAGTKTSKTNTDWKAVITPTAFLSRSTSQTSIAAPIASPSQASLGREPSLQSDTSFDPKECRPPVVRIDSAYDSAEATPATENASFLTGSCVEVGAPSSRPASIRSCSALSIGEQEAQEAELDTFEDLSVQDAQASLYSRDSASIYSRDSTYSSASSIYSSGASIYSLEEGSFEEERDGDVSLGSRGSTGMHYQRRASAVAAIAARRQEAQDPASRERSSLAKKAAMFKNSRLQPDLPTFSASLPAWSMVCRAAQASDDCYDSAALTRRGTYTPANSSKDIKAMIVDDQLIDDSRIVIVAIRGTQFKSLSDWSVNKAAAPVRPTGFLDDEDNEVHGGFLNVTKAMVNQVATQLKGHPAASERPSLLFTGHSAGGAVAAMLYSHMVSTVVTSELTELAAQFPIINCITFGAPPLSLTPLPRREHVPGIFLTVVNEGDPVTRLSDAAYVKSLVKLMTATPPQTVTSALAAPQVKVVRRSRGNGVVSRQVIPTGPVTPWEELPLWPTPAIPLTNAGQVVLLRDGENGSATSSCVTSQDLKEIIFADLVQHTMGMYTRRVKDVAFAAMMGRNLI